MGRAVGSAHILNACTVPTALHHITGFLHNGLKSVATKSFGPMVLTTTTPPQQPAKRPNHIQFPSFYFTPVLKTSTTVKQYTTSLKLLPNKINYSILIHFNCSPLLHNI